MPPAKKSFRIAALGFGLITLAPILDLLIMGHGIPLGYLQFDNFGDFAVSLFTFGANLPFYPADRGFSPGLRIELYIIYFCMFYLCAFENKENLAGDSGAVSISYNTFHYCLGELSR